MRLRALVKWVSWNFSGAKTDACSLARRFVESKPVCNRLQDSSVLFPQVNTATPSTYSVDRVSDKALDSSIRSVF